MKILCAKDIMNKDVICVDPDMDLRELAKLFVEKKITGAPVVDKNGELVGVVSQTDLVGHELSTDREVNIESDFYRLLPEDVSFKKGFHIEDFNTEQVSEIMNPLLITAAESSPVNELASLMLKKHVHRIIITRDNKVKGIVTTMDLLRLLSKQA